jgi:hypothetical protein
MAQAGRGKAKSGVSSQMGMAGPALKMTASAAPEPAGKLFWYSTALRVIIGLSVSV